MWSGGFELDTPGDMFIKIRWAITAGSVWMRQPAVWIRQPTVWIRQAMPGQRVCVEMRARHPHASLLPFHPTRRHRDRGVTMLVRVDVAASAASGVLRCVLSHHPAGFAPYRIDNCSLETLHARQYK